MSDKTDLENLLCAVCGDKRDVRNHYGIPSCPGCKAFFRRAIADNKDYKCTKNGSCVIDMATRNHCKACRLEKCKRVGMKETELRDSRTKSSPQQNGQTPLKNSPPSDHQLNISLLNFLVEATTLVDENYDQNYTNITEDDVRCLDQVYGRKVSLADGIQRPELVAPRTKMRFTYERVMIKEDMAFYWYRTFVTVADFANSIPQFRQLSLEDQCQLFRHNFTFLAWLIYGHAYAKIDLRIGLPIGNGAYMPWNGMPDHGPKIPCEVPSSDKIMSRFFNLMVEPFQDLQVDAREQAFLKALILFQFEENLSAPGREICVHMQNKLLDCLHDYQIMKFPDWTNQERSRRQSRILMLVPRVCQVVHLEHDFQLVLATFGTINLDGIPHELLFYNTKTS